MHVKGSWLSGSTKHPCCARADWRGGSGPHTWSAAASSGTRATPLEDCTILSRDTTIANALHVVVREHLVFLAGADGITEFTVVSDLDRHAVRCYLYVLICELEMRLADRIDTQLGDAGVVPELGKQGKKEYDKARVRGAETRAVEYLYFSQYQQLAPGNEDVVDAFPGPADHLPAAVRELNRLRNVVAHPSASVLARFEPEDVARLASLADQFVVRLRGGSHPLVIHKTVSTGPPTGVTRCSSPMRVGSPAGWAHRRAVADRAASHRRPAVRPLPSAGSTASAPIALGRIVRRADTGPRHHVPLGVRSYRHVTMTGDAYV